MIFKLKRADIKLQKRSFPYLLKDENGQQWKSFTQNRFQTQLDVVYMIMSHKIFCLTNSSERNFTLSVNTRKVDKLLWDVK
jgi:hypothetical protein